MSKKTLDLEDWLYSEATKLVAKSIVERLKRIAPRIEQVTYDAYKDLPKRMATWMGAEGHEDPPVPGTDKRYLPLSSLYLKRKEKQFKKLNRVLGSRQAFYFFTGELQSSLQSKEFSDESVKKIISVKASLDGSHWFKISQKNYYSLEHRLVKKLRNLRSTSSELKFEIRVDKKAVSRLFLSEFGKKNYDKLSYNDEWRPFLTPAIRYVLRRIAGDKINSILGEM